MSHSPHSSLSTPTQTSVLPATPNTPPRTPPTPQRSNPSSQRLHSPSKSLLSSVSPSQYSSTSASPSPLASASSTSASVSPSMSAQSSSAPLTSSRLCSPASIPIPASPLSVRTQPVLCTPTSSPSSSLYLSPCTSPNANTSTRSGVGVARGSAQAGGIESDPFPGGLGVTSSIEPGSDLLSTGIPAPRTQPKVFIPAPPKPALPSLLPTHTHIVVKPTRRNEAIPIVNPNDRIANSASARLGPANPKPQSQPQSQPQPQPQPQVQHQLDPTQPQFHPAAEHTTSIETASNASYSNSSKTPNVYINGLPAHFPEDQLFALTAPFGAVRSVRSFTRHVGEKASGYGFVLFETVESAEKCIDSLRRYRNLHPSFSKQIHKIPGTAYASTRAPHAPSSATSSSHGWEQEMEGGDGEGGEDGDETFKARMERLHDETSTNLYIEGLPLSIDEPTLAALVSPYAIKSSRFFQTKLSHPPRIIAFVRLETRSAAEEIIERLHGRMVRGWNDTGSRISVRFADTSEQRELRRSERAARSGDFDQSPARLTIAQAALLNLRGQELQSQLHSHAAPVIHTRPSPNLHLGTPRGEYADFASNAHLSAGSLGAEYARLAGDFGHRGAGRIQSPGFSPPFQQYAPLPLTQDMDPDMAILLNSLRTSGVPFTGNGSGGYSPEPEYHALPPHVRRAQVMRNQHLLGDLNLNHNLNAMHLSQQRAGMNELPVPLSVTYGQAQAHNGFTPAEELILQAHATGGSHRQLRQNRLAAQTHAARSSVEDANISLGVRGHRAQASALSFPQQQQPFSPMNAMDHLPAMTEHDFHASAANQTQYRQQQQQQQQFDDGNRIATARSNLNHNHHIHPAHVNTRLSRDLDSVQQQQPTSHTQTPYEAHIRSTTLPLRSSSANQHQRHYQHNSMSIPNSSNISNASSIRSNQTQQTQHQTQTQNSITNKHTNGNSNNVYDRNSTHITSKNTSNSSIRHNGDKSSNHNNNSNNNNAYDSHAQFAHPYRDSDVYSVDRGSPPLISPALTYSSHTPTTLSPATPYFASFGNLGESFEGPAHQVEGKPMRQESQ